MKKAGKTIDEYEVQMVDKNGRSLTYNSIEGIVETKNNGKFYSLNILKIIFIFSLLML